MIDSILALEKPVMLFFQSLRVPFLSFLGEAISFLGESTWTTALIFFIFFCVDKKKGFALGSVVMTGHLVNNSLKVVFRIPRPWVKYPDEIIPLRQSTATGYSFPSGHSANGGAMYWGMYRLFKENKIIRTLCVTLLVLIPLSRIYLGVHWPLDVVFGLAIGILIGSLVDRFIILYDNPSRLRILALIESPIAIIAALLDAVLIDAGILDSILWKDISTTFIAWGAIFLSAWLEKRYVDFKIQESWVKRILCFVLSFAIGACVTLLPLSSIPFMHRTMSGMGLLLLVLWEMFFWPLIGVRMGIYKKEEAPKAL